MKSRRVLAVVIIGYLGLESHKPEDLAAESWSFFEKGSAKTVFGPDVSYSKKPKLEYFPVKQAREAYLPTEHDPATTDPTEEPAITNIQNPAEALSATQKILAEYGDPNADAPIPVVDTAPRPFKAMMKALDANDDELAYSYARQYLRHLKNLQTRSSKVSDLVELGMEDEGIKEGDGLKQNKILEDKAYAGALDEKGKALLEIAEAHEAEETKLKEKQSRQDSIQERLERQKLKHLFEGKVPVDPKGAVDVLFFFNAGDENAISMTKEIQALYKKNKPDQRINVMGVSLEVLSYDGIKRFRKKSGATFPIRNDGRFHELFKVSDSPTTVFISRTTGNARYEPGIREYLYLDELVKAIQGGAKL